MKTIEITEKQIKAAMQVASSDEVKKVLNALFAEEKGTPNLDDYTTIHSYEDALEALGEKAPDFDSFRNQWIPKHIIALMKLETISKALWGRSFEPKPDAEGSKTYWVPWFALWTEKEIEERKEEFEKEGALLSGYADYGAGAGFGSLAAHYRSSAANAAVGFRLCQESEEKARYFGKEFIKLWAEYLAFNFTVNE